MSVEWVIIVLVEMCQHKSRGRGLDPVKRLTSQLTVTDRSKAVLLLWCLNVHVMSVCIWSSEIRPIE